MFMTEVLKRCSQLKHRVADIYTQFSYNEPEDRELKSYWLGMAAEEKHHAKILAAEKAAFEVDSNPGYFMPEFEAKLTEMDQTLHQAGGIQAHGQLDGPLALRSKTSTRVP